MSKTLINFIKQNLEQGYDVATIRNHLLSSGYSQKDVDESFDRLYSTQHVVHHLSKSTILVLTFFVLCIIIITTSIFVYFKEPTRPVAKTILDIKLESVKITAQPGGEIIFLRELTNFGKKADITISYSIISVDTAKIITSYQETAAVETKASGQIKIKIPSDSKLGNYILQATANYGEEEAKAALAIKVYKESIIPTCTDNIQNQGELGIDCGGLCEPCKEEKNCPSCDDKEPCTEDYCNEETDFECKHKPITLCCGNKVCEETETENTCSKDCIEQLPDIFKGLTPSDAVEKIKEIAKTDIKKASNYCNLIDISVYKDICFENIAEVTNNTIFCDKIEDQISRDRCYSKLAKSKSDSSACDSIAKESRRDSCYMNFVLDHKDYSVCEKLVNKYLRESCLTLKQMKP